MKALLTTICLWLGFTAMSAAQSDLGVSVLRCNAVSVQLSGIARVSEGQTPHTYLVEHQVSSGVWEEQEKHYSSATEISLTSLPRGIYRVVCVTGEENLILGRARQNKDVTVTSGEFKISDCAQSSEFPPQILPPMSVGITVFPNPAKDEIRVIWPGLAPEGDAWLELYDAMGNLDKRVKMEASDQTLFIGELASGVYFIRIRQADRLLYQEKLSVVR